MVIEMFLRTHPSASPVNWWRWGDNIINNDTKGE
jgi:uncharacterized protein YyaL (SSP411 family)